MSGVAEEIIKGDVGRLLLVLEAEQKKLICAAQQPRALPVRKVEGEAHARDGTSREPGLDACRHETPQEAEDIQPGS